MKSIKKLYSSQFSEANLKLIGLAPALFDAHLTVLERLEQMDSMELSNEARNEIIDIQSVIWDTINADGNLCGVAKWGKTARQICGVCGCTETAEGGLCKECNGDRWVKLEDLDNPDLIRYVSYVCYNLKITKEELRKILV